MPQIGSSCDSSYLWYVNDRSSRIPVYVTWSKVRERLRKPNLLLENTVPRCVCGRNVKTAASRGHAKRSIKRRFMRITFEFSLGLQHPVNVNERSNRIRISEAVRLEERASQRFSDYRRTWHLFVRQIVRDSGPEVWTVFDTAQRARTATSHWQESA
ncbi:hypothetical protein EXN66_Car012085 [Channa argus]|uniref:Uncharacterized protein n=1 Tax=Channa argus TaxID=215402 RepID=A0A6G1Q1M5_CHAAH|nr:hypothetical protein EXN66_Car012085 [Channa argus]